MNANRLFNQLVDITSIRDIELIEFSLLRTIYQYTTPLDLRIYRLNNDNKLISEIVYGREKCTVVNNQKELSGDIKKMVLHLKHAELNEYTESLDSGYLSLYVINMTVSSTTILAVLNHDRVSRENRHLLLGLLEIVRNYISLLSENITDSLTGLLNRKSFDKTIDRIYDLTESDDEGGYAGNRRNNEDTKYWLVMVDIDHFKIINDKYGHLYGDDVLILLAQLIKSCFRQDDLFFRFGGEEFVLLIKCGDLKSAKLVLQRFLDCVATYEFPQVGQVTVSAGAVYIDKMTFSATLLDYADQALYHSKSTGRNKITFFEDLVDKGITKEQEIEPGEINLFH